MKNTLLPAMRRELFRTAPVADSLSFENKSHISVFTENNIIGICNTALIKGKTLMAGKYLLSFIVLFASLYASSQISVTATGGTPGPTTYTTLRAAFTAINLGVHQGAITISVNGNTIEGAIPATLNSSGAGAASYSNISVLAGADSVTISGNPGTGYGVIQLNGADHITIDGQHTGSPNAGRNLYVINTSADTATYSSCIRIATSAAASSSNSVSIVNCNLIGNATGRNDSHYTSLTGSENTSFGIYAGGNGGITATSPPLAINSVTANPAATGTTIYALDLDHNYITACARGIVFNSADSSVADVLNINKNLIGSDAVLASNAPYTAPATTVYNTGIYIAGVQSLNLNGNSVTNLMSYLNTDLIGIDLNHLLGPHDVAIAGNTISVFNNGAGNAGAISVGTTPSSFNIMSNIIGPVKSIGANSIAFGIQTSGTGSNSKIQMNNISAVYNMGNGGAAYGINIIDGSHDTILNNFIFDINAFLSSGGINMAQGAHGIRVAGGNAHKIYFNSVHLNGAFAGSSSAGMSSALTITSSTVTGIDVRNNILVNTMSGSPSGSAVSCIALPGSLNSTFNYTSNANAFYGKQLGQQGTSAPSGYTMGSFDATSSSGANNWRTYTNSLSVSATNDNVSYAKSIAAPFVADDNLHIDTSLLEAQYLYKKAQIIGNVVYDIDGQSRTNTYAAIGADEFLFPLCTGTPTAGTIQATPDSVCSAGTSVLTLQGASAAVGISVLWKWSNNAGGPYTNTGDTTTSEIVSNITADRYYIAQLTCNAGGATVTTPEKKITLLNVSPTASNTGPYTVGQTISLNAVPNSNATYAWNYSWTGPNGFTSTNQNPTIAGAVAANAGTYTVNVSWPGGCTASATTTVVINNPTATTWTGAVDTNWNVAGNWSPAVVPNSSTVSVIIPVTTNQPVTTTPVSVNNLQLNTSARLTLLADLAVAGSFTGGTAANATVAGTAYLSLQGTAQQAIAGKTRVQILKLNNTAGAALQAGATLDVYTSLDLQAGNFNTGSGIITFKSTSSNQIAILDNFSAGYTGTFTGNITAERYYDASSTYQQHFMASPVNAASFSQLGAAGTAGYVIPDANCDERHVASNSPYGNVFSLDETHGATCSSGQWKVEVSGNMQNGVGYSVSRNGAGTVALTGTPNLNTTYTTTGLTNSNWTNTTMQGRAQSSGWHLMANPYLASIKISAANTDFDGQVQVWNTDGPYAGSYQPYITGQDAIIAPFQAYMIHKTIAGGTSNYVATATDRVRTAQTFFTLNSQQLTIMATNTATALIDKTIIGYNSNATNHFDSQYDADKLSGSLNRHTLYSLTDGKNMARNISNSITQTPDVAVGFEPGIAGNYSLSFDGVNTFDATTYIYLEDKKMNAMHNIRNGAYSFTADSTDDWNRFIIHFTPAAQITAAPATCNTPGSINISQSGPASWVYSLSDSTNNIISTGVLNQANPFNINVAAGMYTLTLTDSSNYTVTKTIQVDGSMQLTAAIVIANNTINTGEDVTVSANTNGAVSYQWNFGNGITSNDATATFSYEQAGIYTISLTVVNAYQCTATVSQTVTVTNTTTAINNINSNNNVAIWSNENQVYVDFRNTLTTNATVVIYNVLGQEVSRDKIGSTLLYQKQMDNISAAYFIVDVINSDNTQTTKKLFIGNAR